MISQTLQPQRSCDTPCHAESFPDTPEKQQEVLRQWFMQTYYIGVEQANQARPHQNWLTRLTSAIKLWSK
ncbi:hypothetical protein JCM19237_5410 [Photobacterium aphoticum]|uniref:Uncharacterized protein n=1 Tax=Photobacterium aphoticum TaxID=754436 RepID=A0A090R4F9_9GAMM|nr:hypothetical protein JCM19237_5410 [Photobacterium aphoticum]